MGMQPRKLLKRNGESQSRGGLSRDEVGSADWARWHSLARGARPCKTPCRLYTQLLLGAHPAPEYDIGYLVRAGTEGLSIATQEKSPAQRLEEREVLNDGPDSPRTLGGQQDSQEPAGRKPFQ